MSPIYIYYCDSCKASNEELFTVKNRPKTITCKQCGKKARYEIGGAHFEVNGANAANNYSGDSNYKWYGDDK